MDYDVIIIGAGASGLTAAIAAARQGSSVLVLEQKEKAGKKILATGNGKCNFTNRIQTPECYRSEDSAFSGRVLSCFDLDKTLDFFRELGIYPKERSGYLYPYSEQAASVVSVLLMECERLKVSIRYHEAVKEILQPDFTVVTQLLPEQSQRKLEKEKTGNNKSNGKSEAMKKAAGREIRCQNDIPPQKQELRYYGRAVILATGGCASPQLGSDGSGYVLARSFGHSIIKPLPALVQLKSPNRFLKTLSGVRTGAGVTLFAGQRRIAAEEGEVLFTDYGISGIPVFQISRFAAKAIDRGETVYLKLNFIPGLSTEALTQLINQRIRNCQDKNLEELMVGLLNNKLSYIILKEAGLEVEQSAAQASRQELGRLVRNIREFHMSVEAVNSFANAQVSAGGVSTVEIDAATMESRLRRNLYLTGELVDVDGTCGGYNLQWAWSSGYLAGTAAGRNKPRV